MKETWEAAKVEDLSRVAEEMLPLIRHDVILFYGEMGSGKTTLIREILLQLKTKDEVSSPTYALVNEYDTERGTVFHFDFYRIEDESEAFDMGWEEYAWSGHLCLVEWPERISGLFPENYHTLHIQNSNGVRTITFE